MPATGESDGGERVRPRTLYIVSTPIGNLDDISRRAVRILGEVDLIAAEDTRTTLVLLSHLGIRKPLISYYSRNETRRAPELMERIRRGASLALVTDAGTPGISDPAYALIRAAVREAVAVIPVPGASAVLAALVASGLPADRFIFEGFLPLKKGRRTRWEKLKDEERTIVLYESPLRVVRALEELLEIMGDRRVAVARELTKKFEEVHRGRASEILERLRDRPPRGEVVLVIAGTSFHEQ
jgi:16S rRNA (cytidine1402-2'-O)-methyltransferase